MNVIIISILVMLIVALIILVRSKKKDAARKRIIEARNRACIRQTDANTLNVVSGPSGFTALGASVIHDSVDLDLNSAFTNNRTVPTETSEEPPVDADSAWAAARD